MGKVWGYGGGGRRNGGVGGNVEVLKRGEVKERVVVRLPREEAVRRMVLARHFMYLNRREVRLGMSRWPGEFEENRERWRRLGGFQRAGGKRGGVLRGKLRKCREVVVEQDGGWDWRELGFRSVDGLEGRRERERTKKRKKGEREGLEELEEIKERYLWAGRVARDLDSERVNEVIANYRMVLTDWRKLGGSQPYYTIFLENGVYALKRGRWRELAICLEGMLELMKRYGVMRSYNTFPAGLTALWRLGFLLIVNYFGGEGDRGREGVEKLEQFGRAVYSIFGGHPAWIGGELGAWMVHQNECGRAGGILEEFSVEGQPRKRMEYVKGREREENPKREQCLFLAELVRAVQLYGGWIKAKRQGGWRSLEGREDREDTRRKGEAALAAFEGCFAKWRVGEGEVLMFLEPFIQLTVEFRSVRRARDIWEGDVWGRYDGNYFVEGMFIQFLEEHYGGVEKERELLQFLKKRRTRKFGGWEESREKRREGRRQINRWKETRREIGGKGQGTKVPLPGYTW